MAWLSRLLRPVPPKWELTREQWERLKRADQAKKRAKK